MQANVGHVTVSGQTVVADFLFAAYTTHCSLAALRRMPFKSMSNFLNALARYIDAA